MTRAALFVCALALALAGCGDEPPDRSTLSYEIDGARISVSGISSGAYMAGQVHVAYADVFGGAALLAGGPYDCADGEISRALGPCIGGDDIDVDALFASAQASAAAGEVAPLAGLAGDPIWIFHGAGDAIVDPRVSEAAARFYELAGARVDAAIGTLDVVHGFPTIDTGAPCDEFAEPFLNACRFDAAGELLESLHGPLEARGEASGELVTIPQPAGAELLPEALLYVPAACAAGEACGIHVALHGCRQSFAYVGDAFAAGAGYNEWAETNRLLVLYPQVSASAVMPLNPQGCWDWWGYTGDDYATRSGAQVAAIAELVEALSGTLP